MSQDGTSADHRPVVVGVDGTTAGWTALAWALDRARELRCPLRVVHACDLTVRLLPTVSFDPVEERERYVAVERAIEARTHGAGVHVAISMAVNEGRPPHVLVQRAAGARELVVGQRPHVPGLQRARSTSRTVASRGRIPVVVVPAGAASRTGEVVVGVDGSAAGGAAIAYAFAFAAQRRSPLVALTAWEPDPPYDGADGDRRARGAATARASAALAGWAECYPDVPLRRVLVRGVAGEVLADLSERAALVVVGGRPHARAAGWLLGSTGQALLRHAGGPVAVVHGSSTP